MATTERMYRQLGKVYDLSEIKKDAGKSRVLDLNRALTPNTEKMSAAAVISTPTPDRVSDSMVPNGCKLDNYRKNPQVFWEHGLGGITLPIAKSEDEDGDLTIEITSAGVIGTAYFTNKFLEAEQIFELIVDRLIRATSIRFDPIKSTILDIEDTRIYRFDEWDLEEWSWVTIPCNPEAVNGVISKNRLAGKPIAEPILKSLQNGLPERAVIVRGWTPEPEIKNMDGDDKDKKEDKSKVDPPTPDKNAKGSTGDVEKVNKEPAKTPESEVEQPEQKSLTPENLPMGQRVLVTTFKSVNDLIKGINTGLTLVENEKVQEGVKSAIETLESVGIMLQGTYAEAYPKEKVLEYAEDNDNPEEVLKTFLAGNSGQKTILKGLIARLKPLVHAKTIEAGQIGTLKLTIAQFERILSAAEQAKAAPVKVVEKTPEMTDEQMSDLASKLKALNDRSDSVLPMTRKTG